MTLVSDAVTVQVTIPNKYSITKKDVVFKPEGV